MSLRPAKRVDETFFGRAISNVGRVLYSSNFSIYTLLVATRRRIVLRAYYNYAHINEFKDKNKRDQIDAKYKKAYSSYITTLERVITENIYTKMQKRAASVDEEAIMAKYYETCKFKGNDEVEYRTRLEILCLGMDWGNVQAHRSDLLLDKYKEFYVYNIKELYKAQMRHNAILLANAKDGERDQYEAVYTLIENYIKEVLPILPEGSSGNKIIKDYKRYVAPIDTFEPKSYVQLRKRLALLGFAGELFEFSLPNVAKEQCYEEIIEIARVIITNQYTEADKFSAYEVLLDAIEEYITNILAKRTYWPIPSEKKTFEELDKEWQVLQKLARIDYDCYKRKREVLFIKFDTQTMKAKKLNIPEVKEYYHERLVTLHALKTIKTKPILQSKVLYSKRRLKADDFTEKVEEVLKEPVKYYNELGCITIEADVVSKAGEYSEFGDVYIEETKPETSHTEDFDSVLDKIWNDVPLADAPVIDDTAAENKTDFNIFKYIINGKRYIKKERQFN